MEKTKRSHPLVPRLKAIAENTPMPAERSTEELVVALVGPVGAGVSTAGALLHDLFEKQFKYQVVDLHVSKIIGDAAKLVGLDVSAGLAPDARRARLQDIGTKLRRKLGNSYLADKCIARIFDDRSSDKEGFVGEDRPLPQSRRRVHIIDSLKNPAELDRLREVYGDTFWVFGIFSPEDVRKQRLADLGHTLTDITSLMSRDEEEGVDHGQRVRDTIQHADFFIRNDGDSKDRLTSGLRRCLDLIFGIGIHTPTQDENGMFEASSAATKSACLSRQVGAVIYSSSGELIGKGDNDVPKFGGGLYGENDGAADNRCFRWANNECHNDARKGLLYEAIYKELAARSLLSKDATAKAIEDAVRKTDVKNLIEYSRAVHAEMEAIVSVARGHKAGIVGSTMYTTTYPCHSCARHIVASGISRVVYSEPYTKSLAMKLHRDAVSERNSEEGKKVVFLQYEGVAPKNVLRLFRFSGVDRKKHGKFVSLDPATAKPVFPSPLDGFYLREQMVATKVQAEEEALAVDKVKAHEGAESSSSPATQLALERSDTGHGAT